MNRIEILAMFSALKELCELKQYEAVEKVVKEIYNETKMKKTEDDKN